MDWESITFDWNRARAFLVTAEEGSLSAAARALGTTQPTLGRQVSALERELGVALFERIGGRLRLTPTGLALADHVRTMRNAAMHVSRVASGHVQSVEGMIRISASEAFSAYVLPPLIAELRAAQPGISVELLASNAVSDLRRREADIAIRNAAPTDPELVAQRAADDVGYLYATPGYLARIGGDGPEALSRAHFIGFDDNDAFLAGLRSIGLDVSQSNCPITTTSHLVHWELCRQGHGIGAMAARVGDADPGVRRAAPWQAPFCFPVWIVAHREVKTSRRVRLVYDFLTEAFRRSRHGSAPKT